MNIVEYSQAIVFVIAFAVSAYFYFVSWPKSGTGK
jgi:hypothetical protein